MPNQLEQDPNALATLLRGQYSRPQYADRNGMSQMSDMDDPLNSMISEEDLIQAQEAQGAAGKASGGAYGIASRDSLRQSGLAELRKLLGFQQAKGQAAAYPNQVAGQYGLQEAHIKGGYDVESARQKAAADAASRADTQQFQSSQQDARLAQGRSEGVLNREALAGRATQAQGATSGNIDKTQGYIDARAETKKPFNLLGYLGSKISGSPTGAAPAGPSPRVASGLAKLKQDPQTANLSFDDLRQQGLETTLSPAELAEFQQAWGQ